MTYYNYQITIVDMHKENLDSNVLIFDKGRIDKNSKLMFIYKEDKSITYKNELV